jgi:hypothetical protein
MSATVYDSVNIRIKPLEREIKVETVKRGITSVKNILLEDLLNSIRQSRTESKSITTGFLPENCLSVTIQEQFKSVVVWYPSPRCDYTLFKTVYEDFPLPRLVFGLNIDPKGMIRGCRVAVMENEKPTPASRLYEWPFSNVYRDTGICIGAANSLPTYKDLHTLASLPHHILSIPNNDHNFTRAHNRLNLDYRELLDHLRDRDGAYYYTHILVPRKDGKVLRDFIDQKFF